MSKLHGILRGEFALPAAVEVMGERWSFLIVRAALGGICHFEEFLAVLGIARNILSARLAQLVEHGILDRQPQKDDRRKVAYRLTAKGADLLPALVALRQRGEKYGGGALSNPVLVDSRDCLPLAPVQLRAADGRALGHGDLQWIDRERIGQPGAPEQ